MTAEFFPCEKIPAQYQTISRVILRKWARHCQSFDQETPPSIYLQRVYDRVQTTGNEWRIGRPDENLPENI